MQEPILEGDIVRLWVERERGTEFTSVSDYVTYVLSGVLGEDEEQIKARLKALGYID